MIFCLQFIGGGDAKYVYLYLTNWTFTLFLLSSTLDFTEYVSPLYLTHFAKRIIFTIGLITKPTYLYVCVFYSFSLILNLFGFGDLLEAEGFQSNSGDFIFYFNDVSKHFVFIILLIVLFVFSPRDEKGKLLYKWWKFTYSLGFILAYLLFSLIYFRATNTKIYRLSNVVITLMSSTLPVAIFFIFMGFKLADDKIRTVLFSGDHDYDDDV